MQAKISSANIYNWRSLKRQFSRQAHRANLKLTPLPGLRAREWEIEPKDKLLSRSPGCHTVANLVDRRETYAIAHTGQTQNLSRPRGWEGTVDLYRPSPPQDGSCQIWQFTSQGGEHTVRDRRYYEQQQSVSERNTR